MSQSSKAAQQLAAACAAKMLSEDAASQGLGMTVNVDKPGQAKVTMTIQPDMVNGHEICHGGFIFTLADSAFAFACNGYNEVTVAASAAIDFVRPAILGDQLTATAHERHRGKRSGLYDVTVTNQAGKLVASFRGRSATLGGSLVQN
ncbi:MAG: hydroxyphenylacetyl-CoA thioesterase PaaI [Lysobacterales bacterium]